MLLLHGLELLPWVLLLFVRRGASVGAPRVRVWVISQGGEWGWGAEGCAEAEHSVGDGTKAGAYLIERRFARARVRRDSKLDLKAAAMDALIAQADALQPLRPLKRSRAPPHTRRPNTAHTAASSSHDQDHTLRSIVAHTALPTSLRPSSPLPDGVPTHNHIANKKLRTHLHRQSAHAARSKVLLRDAELLLPEEAGRMEVEGEMDRTWRVGQDEIVRQVGAEVAKGRREMVLDGGPYRARYTRNGR